MIINYLHKTSITLRSVVHSQFTSSQYYCYLILNENETIDQIVISIKRDMR